LNLARIPIPSPGQIGATHRNRTCFHDSSDRRYDHIS